MVSFLWIIAGLGWISPLVGYWFTADADKVDAVFGMCVCIGLMLMANRINELGKKWGESI